MIVGSVGPGFSKLRKQLMTASVAGQAESTTAVRDNGSRWPFHRRVPNVALWDMIPDLAVEVVSPSNTADYVQEKVGEYFHGGVRQVWVVYPRQQTVYLYTSPTQIEVL
jgi:Uma2 family endonuclease